MISPGALNGPNTFAGGGGDDTFTVDVGAGIPAEGLTIDGGTGHDVVNLIGRPGDDAVAYRAPIALAAKASASAPKSLVASRSGTGR